MVNVILYLSLLIAPEFNGWDTLSMLTIENVYDDFIEDYFEVPRFSDHLLTFDGKVVTIEGYVIPIQQSVNQDYFVLSRFPYSSCFFCGNAGAETVAEVYTNTKSAFKDERVEVTGILKLNSDDPLHLFYIIEDAEVIKK